MYLYGASGHAKVIIDILRANHEPIEALFDDNEKVHHLFDYPVLRPSKVCGPLIISIGNNGIRRKIAKELKKVENLEMSSVEGGIWQGFSFFCNYI